MLQQYQVIWRRSSQKGFSPHEKKEFILSFQLLRSGKSISASSEEVIEGLTDQDFLARLDIAYKQLKEIIYCLRLLNVTEYLSNKEFKCLFNDAEEICKNIIKTQTTIKSRIA